jgi:LmbE family N-acetylglucosaminyl deacetylase
MNAADYLRAVETLPVGSLHGLTGDQPFLVLSPHPDDESLGAGGLIALARRNAIDATLVLLTDGSKSHPNSRAYPPERLVATRMSELRAAASILGVPPAQLFDLGLPDTALPSSGAAFADAAARIVTIVTETDARSIFVTWQYDPHCDHEAAALLAKEVCRRCPWLRLWAYPVWGWHLPGGHPVPAPGPTGLRLLVESVLAQKRAAIDAHVSQMTGMIDDDPDGFRFTPETLAPFIRPHEYFIEVPK